MPKEYLCIRVDNGSGKFSFTPGTIQHKHEEGGWRLITVDHQGIAYMERDVEAKPLKSPHETMKARVIDVLRDSGVTTFNHPCQHGYPDGQSAATSIRWCEQFRSKVADALIEEFGL